VSNQWQAYALHILDTIEKLRRIQAMLADAGTAL